MEANSSVDSALSERSKQVVTAIKKWDRHDIMELHALLMELKKIVILFDQDPSWYVSREQIPSVALPPELAAEQIWGCDLHGICLVKSESEFSFRARAVSDLAPNSGIDGVPTLHSLEILKTSQKKRITIQLGVREYSGMVRAMMQDEESKIASWVRALIVKEVKGRGVKI